MRGGDGVVVKRLACGAGDRDWSPGLSTMISEIGYLPLPSRDMTEIPLKRRKNPKSTQPNPTQPNPTVGLWSVNDFLASRDFMSGELMSQP